MKLEVQEKGAVHLLIAVVEVEESQEEILVEGEVVVVIVEGEVVEEGRDLISHIN